MELRVRANSGGEAFVDAEAWNALQPKQRTLEEGRRAGGRKSTNPERYPISTRIVELTDGCGSALHGRKSGERLVYECGRYVNSGAAECHHNTVDADAMLKLVLDSLVECVTKAGGREAIRERLLAKARAEPAGEAPDLDRPRLRGVLEGQAALAPPATGRHRLRPGEPADPRPWGLARRRRGDSARGPAAASVGDPAGPPLGPRRRRARHGGPRRSRRVTRRDPRQSGHPGVLSGPLDRIRCLWRRWHR